jgi:hypothetical protein
MPNHWRLNERPMTITGGETVGASRAQSQTSLEEAQQRKSGVRDRAGVTIIELGIRNEELGIEEGQHA